jgi:hypothetical protein
MPAIYFWSYDNPAKGDYRRPAREFLKIACVQRVAPKTTLRLERHRGVTFSDVKAAAARCLDGRKGRGILFSTRTGHAYVCDNARNRPGHWIRID